MNATTPGPVLATPPARRGRRSSRLATALLGVGLVIGGCAQPIPPGNGIPAAANPTGGCPQRIRPGAHPVEVVVWEYLAAADFTGLRQLVDRFNRSQHQVHVTLDNRKDNVKGVSGYPDADQLAASYFAAVQDHRPLPDMVRLARISFPRQPCSQIFRRRGGLGDSYPPNNVL
jgi:hypothetical protein